MKVYVASSWRNEARQQAVVAALRTAGHEVYDFRHPEPGNEGFSWRSCATREQLTNPVRFRDEVLTHPIARNGFDLDMGALQDANAVVLVLPCERSAHLELGWAVGAGKRTIVLLDEPMSKPELMYLMVSRISAPVCPRSSRRSPSRCHRERAQHDRVVRLALVFLRRVHLP